MMAQELARSYFERMQAGDPKVVELFADDAVLVGLGRRIEGIDAVRAFYERSIAEAGPQPRVEMLVGGDDRALAEIRIALRDGELHVVDLFEAREGKITSLTYFVADDGTAPHVSAG